jgi:hypothetical protein
MTPENIVLLSCAFSVIAFFYASVGHAGASGYIAVMTLLGLAPETIRPLALGLNILVAGIATWQFRRAGHFSWSLFWPFALLSIPAAFLGGYLKLPSEVLKLAIGMVILYSAWRFFGKSTEVESARPPSWPVALACGGLLGFLAGLTGTGGGIFLTPLLLLMKWAGTKTAAGVSALFILVNSTSGLLGHVSATRNLPEATGWFLCAVLLGGFAGAHLGSHRFSHTLVKRLLASVLTVAGLKLVFA